MIRTINYMNQASVKQTFKDVVGMGAFVLGVGAIYSACKGQWLTKMANKDEEGWGKSTHRFALGCAHVSLILSATVSPVGVWALSRVANTVFSAAQLGVLGPNTIFADNPWHPRHVVSFLAVGLAFPFGPFALHWGVKSKRENYLQWAIAFTVITSRPALHVANDLACRFFK
jgi:hypothetical protein